jgi:hypothetical protein
LGPKTHVSGRFCKDLQHFAHFEIVSWYILVHFEKWRTKTNQTTNHCYMPHLLRRAFLPDFIGSTFCRLMCLSQPGGEGPGGVPSSSRPEDLGNNCLPVFSDRILKNSGLGHNGQKCKIDCGHFPKPAPKQLDFSSRLINEVNKAGGPIISISRNPSSWLS